MSILQGYTEATSILNELFGRKKNKQKEYHHLNRDEIKEIVAICKRNINKFPKLKKCTTFKNTMSEYYQGSGNEGYYFADVDVWDGYPNPRNEYDLVTDDENEFFKLCNNECKENNILAEITAEGDWDTFDFVAFSKKVKEEDET